MVKSLTIIMAIMALLLCACEKDQGVRVTIDFKPGPNKRYPSKLTLMNKNNSEHIGEVAPGQIKDFFLEEGVYKAEYRYSSCWKVYVPGNIGSYWREECSEGGLYQKTFEIVQGLEMDTLKIR
jgi:hypothetical protein